MLILGLIVIAICSLLFPLRAYAQVSNDDVALILQNVNEQAAGFGQGGGGLLMTLMVLSYGVGVVLIGRGLLKMKESADNPSQVKAVTPIASLGVGAGLAALGATANTVSNTLGLDASQLGQGDSDHFLNILGALQGNIAQTYANQGISEILFNVLQDDGSLAAAWLLVVGLSVVVGLTLIAVGIHKFKEAGDGNHQVKASHAFSYAALGGALVSLPTLVQTLLNTLGLHGLQLDAINRQGVNHGIWESLLQGMDHMGTVQVFVVAVGAVIGVRMLMTGLIKLKEASDGKGKAATGAYYLFFGAALCVVPGVIASFVNTFGLAGQPAWDQNLGQYETLVNQQAAGIASAANAVTSGMPTVVRLAMAVAMVIAVVSVVRGLIALAQTEDSEANRGQKAKNAIVQVAVGSVLGAVAMAIQSTIDTFGWATVVAQVGQTFGLSSTNAGGAAANGLGSALNVFQDTQANFLMYLVFAVSLAGGAALIVKGINGLKDMEFGDRNGSAGTPVMNMLAGAALLALPSFAPLAAQSVGLLSGGMVAVNTSAAGVANCSGAGWQCAIGGFATNAAGPLTTATLAISMIMGAVLVASSLFGFAKVAQQGGRESVGGLLTKLVVGAILLDAYDFFDVLASATFGLAGTGGAAGGAVYGFSASANQCVQSLALSYGVNGASAAGAGTMTQKQVADMLALCFIALYPFGLIAAVRGLLMMRDHAEGNKQVGIGHAATYMVGGTALMNAHAVATLTVTTLSPKSPILNALNSMSAGGISC